MSVILVEFYKITNGELPIKVRSEECFNEFEADELAERESHMYDLVKIVNVKE